MCIFDIRLMPCCSTFLFFGQGVLKTQCFYTGKQYDPNAVRIVGYRAKRAVVFRIERIEGSAADAMYVSSFINRIPKQPVPGAKYRRGKFLGIQQAEPYAAGKRADDHGGTGGFFICGRIMENLMPKAVFSLTR